MPHVIVKLWPGKSEHQKRRLAEAITKEIIDILHYGDESVSVAMEEVSRKIGGTRCTNLTFKTSGICSTRSPDMM